VGKTTLARLMANAFNAEFISISAVNRSFMTVV
jgi:replication-associated recombination protein RarA